ncbi:hypothetical protein SAMN02745130_01066 [Thiothrix eikelboomii]|uniref:Uncharacterized protein n=1 Tax=Thiothrix eikelboomii TaxID=92487 RepID=A0A1T4W5E4_9GAMM|nr:hypothetical protein [Thiothrix eikelboomii]SKA72427.1 hypothetical protein SAMN02745130_01066 [Thiothrix eikelboomii]
MDSLNTQQPTQTIYYWLDGYWVKDKEEAELMDSINAFGSLHQVVELPLNADIDREIQHLLKV